MRGNARRGAQVVDVADEILDEVELPRPRKPVGDTAVVRDADRAESRRGLGALEHPVPKSLGCVRKFLVQMKPGGEANELNAAAGGANHWKLGFHARVVTRLPGVDARLLASHKKFDDALVSEPFEHVLVKEPVEVRVAINGVAAHDQPRDPMRTEGHGRQKHGGLLGPCRRRRHQPRRHRCRSLQEVAAGRATALSARGLGRPRGLNLHAPLFHGPHLSRGFFRTPPLDIASRAVCQFLNDKPLSKAGNAWRSIVRCCRAARTLPAGAGCAKCVPTRRGETPEGQPALESPNPTYDPCFAWLERLD